MVTTERMPQPGGTQSLVAKFAEVEEQLKRRISESKTYGFYFREITVRFNDGKLTLQGRVPTFHLKQILQTLLRGVDGVDSIDNQVDVVSPVGLSSVKPK